MVVWFIISFLSTQPGALPLTAVGPVWSSELPRSDLSQCWRVVPVWTEHTEALGGGVAEPSAWGGLRLFGQTVHLLEGKDGHTACSRAHPKGFSSYAGPTGQDPCPGSSVRLSR